MLSEPGVSLLWGGSVSLFASFIENSTWLQKKHLHCCCTKETVCTRIWPWCPGHPSHSPPPPAAWTWVCRGTVRGLAQSLSLWHTSRCVSLVLVGLFFTSPLYHVASASVNVYVVPTGSCLMTFTPLHLRTCSAGRVSHTLHTPSRNNPLTLFMSDPGYTVLHCIRFTGIIHWLDNLRHFYTNEFLSAERHSVLSYLYQLTWNENNWAENKTENTLQTGWIDLSLS